MQINKKQACSGIFWSLLVAAAALVLAACGGGGGGGGGTPADPGPGLSVGVSLKEALNPTFEEVPVLATTLLNQTGQAIPDTRIKLTYKQGNLLVTAGDGETNIDGVIGHAVAAGSYDYSFIDLSSDNIGEFYGTYTVTSAATQFNTQQTSEQNVRVTSGDLTSVELRVYQLDASGDIIDIVKPTLKMTDEAPNDNLSSITTELFAGQYRFVVQGTSSKGDLAVKMTDVITILGGGATETPQNIDLSTAGNVVALTLTDPKSLPLAEYFLSIFDTTTGLPLGEAVTDEKGSGSFLVDSGFTSITVRIKDDLGEFVGLYINDSLTADDIQTLTQVTIRGAIEPLEGLSLDLTDAAWVTFETVDVPTSLVGLFNGNSAPLGIDAAITLDGNGLYTIDLFPGNYVFGVRDVEGYANVTPQVVTAVTVATTAQNVNVPVGVGGVITGRLQDQANSNLAGKKVEIFGANSLTDSTVGEIESVFTDENGVYAVELPYGTYDLWVEGAVTTNLIVSASSVTVTQDIRRHQVTARVIDQFGQGVDAFIISILGIVSNVGVSNPGATAIANSLGVYTLDVFEGLNNICLLPPASRATLGGQSCAFSVEVSQTTIDSLQ